MLDRLPESGFQNERFGYSRLSPRLQAPIHATVFAEILLPSKEVGPIPCDICVSAHSTAAADHKGNYVYFSTFVKGEFSPPSPPRLSDFSRASALAQAWPQSCLNQSGPSYGFASERGYQPDWRKQNENGYASQVVSLWVRAKPKSIPAPEPGEQRCLSLLTPLHARSSLFSELRCEVTAMVLFGRKSLPRRVL